MKENPFKSQKTVFKDASTFDQGWTPRWQEEDLPCREEEIKSLTALYKPVINQEGNYCVNSIILGRGGVGKTITARYFGRMFRDAALESGIDMTAEYVDCNENSTRNAVLREVLRKLRVSTGRGYSDPELMKQLVSHLKMKNKYLFLILDEVQKLEHDDLLAFLNASITFGSHNVRMSFLCVSRSNDWLKYSTERLTSRIQKVYKFDFYREPDAYTILKFRDRLAFYSGTFSDDIIRMIAKMSAKEKNMRSGIEIMRRVALHLDENNKSEATPEMVREAGGNAISNYDTNLLNYLSNEHEYLVLLAVARFFMHSDQTYLTSSDIYEQYELLTEEYEINPLKFATLKRYIKRIEEYNLLSKTFALPEGKKRGRESRYSLNNFTAEKLEEQLSKMLEHLFKR